MAEAAVEMEVCIHAALTAKWGCLMSTSAQQLGLRKMGLFVQVVRLLQTSVSLPEEKREKKELFCRDVVAAGSTAFIRCWDPQLAHLGELGSCKCFLDLSTAEAFLF